MLSVRLHPRLLRAGALVLAATALGLVPFAAQAAPTAQPLAKVVLGGAGGVVVSVGGSVWATDTVLNRLVQIDPKTNRVTARIPAGRRPLGIAYGARSLWVASSTSNNVIRIDPRSHRVRKRIRTGFGPYDVAFGAGAVWATNELSATLARINPRTNRVVARIRGVGQPNGVTYAFGSIWVADLRVGRLLRVDPRRNRISGRVAIPAADWITASPDSLWVSSERGTVTRVDAKTLRVVARIRVGANPLASAWIDGELWVPNIDDDTVSIVDPARDAVRKTFSVGDGPIAVAQAAGDVWITHENDAVWRLSPSGLR